uniref:Uncharacterized protein n=1 Tax=Glossina brevipalpis TaxID=37001 RepID=A0A1A9WSB7_9MUSC
MLFLQSSTCRDKAINKSTIKRFLYFILPDRYSDNTNNNNTFTGKTVSVVLNFLYIVFSSLI